MRLADDCTALTVIDRHTNVSGKPHTIWLRWHPYMALDDPKMTRSAILIPGPEPQALRRVNIGSPQDANFRDVPGYWMVANAHVRRWDVDDLRPQRCLSRRHLDWG